MKLNRKNLRDVLKNHTLKYWHDESSGDSSYLIDILSPFETIKEGKEEIEHLIDHIMDEFGEEKK